MASILDGLPGSEQEMRDVFKLAEPIIKTGLEELKLSPKRQSILDLVKEGLSLADIADISKEEREAMLLQGYKFIKQGDLNKAEDWLWGVYQLDQLDDRVIYALAVTIQAKGDFARAAKLFVVFLALDATNAEGYLRLGECFLSAKEYDNAQGCFRVAEAECNRGNGNAQAAAHAKQMLAYVAERRTAS
jgi:tetratricopeptide (TPR) repeat protein